MIQRIQTLYLFASLVLIALIFLVPVAELTYGNSQHVIFRITGFYDDVSGSLILPAIPVLILVSVIACLYIISIFLFKRRIIQVRLCVINMVLLAGLVGLYIYHLAFFLKKVPGVDYKPELSFLFPIIALILTYLAFRGIRKDENLVRLAERLR
jgi:hypothetical protein